MEENQKILWEFVTSDFSEAFTPFQNLLFNLLSGLEPKNMTDDEIKLCEENGLNKKALGLED